VAGLVHCAGVLDDGVLLRQTWPRFEAVLGAKATGAWNLHRATLADPLEHFVLFSSAAAVLGSAGQSNYAAANAALDALAHVRREQGLPALSIDWGPWEGAGLAARAGRDGGRSVSPLPVAQAVGILERLMALGGGAPAQVAAVRWRPEESIEARRGAPDLRSRLREALPAERPGLVVALVQQELGRILGRPGDPAGAAGPAAAGDPGWDVPEWDSLRRDVTFHDLGLDSLMAVELRNGLRQATGLDLSATALFDYPSLPALAGHLDALLLDALPLDALPLDALPLDALPGENGATGEGGGDDA
jgi:acyl carrier protein